MQKNPNDSTVSRERLNKLALARAYAYVMSWDLPKRYIKIIHQVRLPARVAIGTHVLTGLVIEQGWEPVEFEDWELALRDPTIDTILVAESKILIEVTPLPDLLERIKPLNKNLAVAYLA